MYLIYLHLFIHKCNKLILEQIGMKYIINHMNKCDVEIDISHI